ncbi:MAG: hypothetical protein KGY74_08255 [Candidatus Cloacimonetes bacterium]|nr:hypothetical protein [Candidatus Cloacimonadota bacterium]
MFKRIAVITIILGLFISVNLFASEEDDAGPWIQVIADESIDWIVDYSDGGYVSGSGDHIINAVTHEGATADLIVNGNIVDSGTVPLNENGWLYLEVPWGVPDPDEPETY